MLLCNEPNIDFDFMYHKSYVQEIKECAIRYNSLVSPEKRLPIILVIAQSIQETGYGTSRFYEEANNLFGIIALEGEDYITSQIDDKKMRRYKSRCESVNHYMELLTTDINYDEFQNILTDQYVRDQINIDKLIYALYNYAEDPNYENKLRKIVKKLQDSIM